MGTHTTLLLRKYKGVLLDTSFVIQCVDYGRDIYEELMGNLGLEPVVPDAVLRELQGLTRAKGLKGRKAAMALKLINRCRIIDSGVSSADEALLKLSGGGEYIVATTDSRLRRILKERGVPVAFYDKDGNLRVE